MPHHDDTEHRRKLVNGLMELAVYLAQHPDVPVPAYPHVSCCLLAGDDETGIAAVRAAAVAMGGSVDEDEGAEVTRSFGPVDYKVFYVARQSSAQHRALMSYHGAVEVAA